MVKRVGVGTLYVFLTFVLPGLAAAQTCLTSTGTWQNAAFPSQSGSFTATFDSSVSTTPVNATVGLSLGAQSAYTGFAAIVRFNPTGQIDARNDGAYAAASSISAVVSPGFETGE